ncbi:MAG: hypothetical protein F4210_09040 [Holophagales bacterium]|nr:hypothetical protein [Holophagales bacterium]MYF95638.1 hypothetical protein [Holophagales bacterium]
MITVLRNSAVLIGGRRYWLLLLSPLLWLAGQAVLLIAGRLPTFEPVSAQNTLIGVPVAILGAFLGGRIIAGELDQRTLEIAYTVPGGASRVWLGKLAAAGLMLLVSLSLMAVFVFTFFTGFPVVQTLHGAAQAAAFYMVTAMGLGSLFRSETAGALGTTALLGLEAFIVNRLGEVPNVSPFWNPLNVQETDAAQVLAMAVQNRIGTALAIAAIVALTFTRAERREKMLGR